MIWGTNVTLSAQTSWSVNQEVVLILQISFQLHVEITLFLPSILTAIFQVNLGQPVPTEAKDDGGGGDNWTTGAISHVKLQSNHHHQQINIQCFITGRMPFLSPNQQWQSIKGKKYHILAHPKLTWGSSNFVSNH